VKGKFKGMRNEAATEGRAGWTQASQRGVRTHQSSVHPTLKRNLRVSRLWAAKPPRYSSR